MNAAHARAALAAAHDAGADLISFLVKPGGIPAWHVALEDVEEHELGIAVFEAPDRRNNNTLPQQTWLSFEDLQWLRFSAEVDR